jgi:pimeloyl-ACP methyl ester carboxylesterase
MLRSLLEDWRAEMLAPPKPADGGPTAPDDPTAGLDSFISAPDRAAITPQTAAFAAARRKHALEPGIWGWYDDDLTETKPWGFEPTAIRIPVAVWHGAQDRFVPFAHGQWLAAHIPDSSPHLLAEEGHFSIIDIRFHEIVDDLISLVGRR